MVSVCDPVVPEMETDPDTLPEDPENVGVEFVPVGVILLTPPVFARLYVDPLPITNLSAKLGK